MKAWQFLMLASFIFGSPRMSEKFGVAMQLLCLVAATIFALVEWRKW